MASLYEILNNSHDGEGIAALAREFGLTPTQTQAAVTALLPAVSTGLKQSTATPDGLGNLFGLMGQQPDLQDMYDDPETAFGPDGVAAGNDALSVIFGSPDMSRACTSGKARKPRSRQAVNERPAIASVLIGHSADPVVLPSEPEITVDPAVPPSDPEITAAATPNIPDDPAKTEDAAEVAPASIVKESAAAPLVSIERSRTHSKSVQRRDQDDRKYVRHRGQDNRTYVRHRNQDDRTYVQRRTRNEDSPSPRHSSQNHYQSGYARVW